MFDYTKAPKTLVTELINEDNATNLLANLIELTVPAAPAVEYVGEKNTAITVSGAVGSGYTGSVPLFYDRVAVTGFVGTVDLTFQLGDAQNVADLVPEVNSLLNINLTADDFTDAALPAFGNEPNETQPVDVVIAAGSLVYTGTLTINVSNGELSLVDLITTTELNGFFIDPTQVVDAPIE